MTQIVTSPGLFAGQIFLPLHAKVAKAMNGKGFAIFMVVDERVFKSLARILL